MADREHLTPEGINSLTDVFYRSIIIDQLKISFQGIRYDEIADASIPSHTHHFFEFHYLLSGKVNTTVNAIRRTYGPGQCYLMPPAAVHSHECLPPPDQVYCGITIRWALQTIPKDVFNPELNRIIMAMERSRAEIIDDPDGAIAGEINAIIALARENASKTELMLRLSGLVIRIGQCYASIRNEKRRLPEMPRAAEAILYPAIRFIEDHCMENISPADVTAFLSISYSHLARLFSLHLHSSITHYILRVKMDRAIHLLLSTDSTIQDVSAQLGFSSPSYFSRIFKAIAGRSPRAYLQYAKEHAGNGDFSIL